MIEKFEKLVAANIQLLPIPEIEKHFVFERDGFAALVERVPSGFGRIGAGGLLTEKGIAPLVWRGEHAFFVTKGFEQPANDAAIQQLRRFQTDLDAALA